MSLSDLKITSLRQDGADFEITSDGKVSLAISVSDTGNFEKSNRGPAMITVPLQDLEPFLAGLTISPVGIDGSCDEVTVRVLRQNGKYEVLVLDNYVPKLHDPYVHWTEDNDYEEPELTALQARMAFSTTLAEDIKEGQRFGMSVDMYDTVFAENLSQAFLNGIAWFQAWSNSCFTRIILPEDAPFQMTMGSKYHQQADGTIAYDSHSDDEDD